MMEAKGLSIFNILNKQNYKYFLIFLGFLIFGGIISCVTKYFPDYDFISYHFQNGWAFWNNRIDIDFLPSNFRSYFNPYLDAVNYFLIHRLNSHPLIFLFISGFKYGFFLFLCFMLFNKLFQNKGAEKKIAVIFSLLFAFCSPVAIAAICFDFVDLQIASMLLIVLNIIIYNFDEPSVKKQLFSFSLAGFIFGLATGLKYSSFVFGLPFFLCFLFNYKSFLNPIKIIFFFFSSALLGFLLSDGYWMYYIFRHFHNPIFPYLNNIFHSEFGNNSLILDVDYYHLRTDNFFVFIFRPFADTLKYRIGYEHFFFDLKLPLTFIITSLYLLFKVFKINVCDCIKDIINPKYFNTLIIFLISAYYFNAYIFGQLRYVLALIPVSCIIITVFAFVIASYIKKINYTIMLVLTIPVLFVLFKYSNFMQLEIIIRIIFLLICCFLVYILCFKKDIISDFIQKFYCVLFIISFGFLGLTHIPDLPSANELERIVDIEPILVEDNATVLLGTISTGFVIPAFNPNAKYIAYGLQPEFLKQKFNMFSQDWFVSLIEYSSPYLRNLTKESLENQQKIYLIYAYRDSYYYVDEIKEIYNKSFSEYLGKQIDVFENCTKINYSIFSFYDYHNDFVLCQINKV